MCTNAPQQQFHCSVCECPNIRFLPLPGIYRENAIKHGYLHFGKAEMIALDTYSCSNCGASDRERFYAHWIREQVSNGNLKKGDRVLHIAPEMALSTILRNAGLFFYETADFAMEGVNHRVDLMNLPFGDKSWDFFICSHVLEHVENDDRAIRELFRVTRSGGMGILVAPIILNLQHTHEDPTVVSESERWRHFGQNDHVRLYAHDDYVQKIKSHGFLLQELGIKELGKDLFARLGLSPTSILYIVRKS